MFITYVIKNENGDIYIGQTSDITTRLKRHNGILPTKQSSYTSKRKIGLWKLVYSEEFKTRAEAMKREKQLKSYQGRQYIHNIIEKMGR